MQVASVNSTLHSLMAAFPMEYSLPMFHRYLAQNMPDYTFDSALLLQISLFAATRDAVSR